MVEIKGSAFVDTISKLKQRWGDGTYRKVLNDLNPETRQRFEKTIFLSSGWYPLDDFVQFIASDVKLTADGNVKELTARSESIIESQLRGIYRVFVKIGSPEFVINRIAKTHESYFRGVSIDAKLAAPKKAIVRYTGFECRQSLIGFVIVGFFKKALEISGATDVSVVFTTPIEKSAGSCELEITWKNK